MFLCLLSHLDERRPAVLSGLRVLNFCPNACCCCRRESSAQIQSVDSREQSRVIANRFLSLFLIH